MHKIYEAAAEGSSSWTLGEYAVSIRSDLRSTASLPPHKPRQIAYHIHNERRGDRPHESRYFIGLHSLAAFHATLSAAFASRQPCVA